MSALWITLDVALAVLIIAAAVYLHRALFRIEAKLDEVLSR